MTLLVIVLKMSVTSVNGAENMPGIDFISIVSEFINQHQINSLFTTIFYFVHQFLCFKKFTEVPAPGTETII